MLSFDKQLRDTVLRDFGEHKGGTLARNYEQAQQKLQDDVYPYIPAAEPDLSDHGATHIANVQANATRLLSDDGIVTSLSGIEMYCLGMLILFHDVGNVLGRKDHHKRIPEIFDQVRPGAAAHHEKSLVVRAARAHTGRGTDGSRDTLKGVDEVDHLEREKVRLRQLAAVVRFADELAEGPQRTSEVMQNLGRFSVESQPFHRYASSTHVFIDRGAGRIVLTYEIDIPDDGEDTIRLQVLTDFLQCVYERIIKVDQERQYARHYSELLAPFKATEVTFNFHCGTELLETDLSPLKLTDLVVPGDPVKEIPKITTIDPKYDIARLAKDVLSKCWSRRDHETRY